MTSLYCLIMFNNGGFKKVVQKALTYKIAIHRLKSIFFNQLTLLSTNVVLMSYLSNIYLES